MNSAIAAPPASTTPAVWADATVPTWTSAPASYGCCCTAASSGCASSGVATRSRGTHGLVISDAEADTLLVSGADDRAAEAHFHRHDP